MTPPLPLAELVKQLPVAIEDMEQSVAAWRGIVEVPALTAAQMATIRVLSSALHYLALPLGRCETCREWQPIETAPKDGRRVLLWAKEWQATHAGCWYSVDWKTDYDASRWLYSPTHWMPMPTPPAAGEETR